MKKIKYVILTCMTASSIFFMDTSVAHAAGVPSIFDASYYSEKNPDVAKSIGNNQELLYQHFLNYGLKEGRTFSMLFDVEAYKKANSDLTSAFGNNNLAYYLHFINYGLKENRNGGGEFNATAYLKANPDLAKTIGNNPLALYQQFITTGRTEGRKVFTPVNNTKKEPSKKPSKPSKPSGNNGNHNNKPKPEEKPPIEEPKITVVSITGDTDDKEFKDILDKLIIYWEDFEYQDTRTLGEDFWTYTDDFLYAYGKGGCVWFPDVTKPTLEKNGKLEGTMDLGTKGKNAEVELKVILPKLEKSESWIKEQTIDQATKDLIDAIDAMPAKIVEDFEEEKIIATVKKAITDDSIEYVHQTVRVGGGNSGAQTYVMPRFVMIKENDPDSPFFFNYYREINFPELTEEEELLFETVKSNLEAHAADFDYTSVGNNVDNAGQLFRNWMYTELESYNLPTLGNGGGIFKRGEHKLMEFYFEVTLEFNSEHSKKRTAIIQRGFPPYHVIQGNITKKYPVLGTELEAQIDLPLLESDSIAQTEEISTEEVINEEQSSEETAFEEDSTQENSMEEISTEENTEEETIQEVIQENKTEEAIDSSKSDLTVNIKFAENIKTP